MATPIALPVVRTEPTETPAVVARAEAPPAAPPAAKVDAPREPAPQAAPEPAERPPSTRLMIEDVGGVFVYTVLDRVSGQVIARIPRDSVERLSEVDGYKAGAMVNTEA